MEIQDTGGRIVTIDGVKFVKLSPNDRRQLLAPVRAARRASLRQTMEDAGISAPEMVNELDAFDQAAWGDFEFNKFAASADGQAEILKFSAGKADNDSGVAAKLLDEWYEDMNQTFKVVAALAGIKLGSPRETKHCPSCGETVLAKAGKCQFCKEEIPAALLPDEDEQRPSVAGS